MILNAYTDDQVRTLRILIESTDVKGYENCKNIVMIREIIDHGSKVEVKEETDGEEIKN